MVGKSTTDRLRDMNEFDPFIYTVKPGQPYIPLGDYIGEMTNELDDDDFIIEFTTAGPKNYSYKTH